MDSNGGEDLFENPFSPFEEEGYEADQDSDGSTENGSSQPTHIIRAELKNNSTQQRKEANKSTSRVMHPWLINILLKKLADKVELDNTITAKPFLKFLKHFLQKILDFQMTDTTNNSYLKHEVRIL